jgi:polyisoprenoid-binding protein YceI
VARSQERSRFFAGNLLPIAGYYEVDPVHSFVQFSVQHLVVGQIKGSFASMTGKIRVAQDPLFSSIEASVDTSSLYTHDAQRDTHLRGELFFDVEKFPRMTFRGTRILTEPGGSYTVEGDLTVRDVTRPVSLAVRFSGIVDDPWGNTRVSFQARGSINRKDFGLVTELDHETGGLLVGKDVKLDLSIEALYKDGPKP